MLEPLPDEAELVKRCAKGDTEAFGRLVTHYEDAIFNLVFRMVGNREDARDVTQEVFIRAFRSIGLFEGRSRFGTWLYSIAVNQSITERRRRALASRTGEVPMSALARDDGEAAYDPAGEGPAPSDRLDSEETRRAVEEAIAELPEEHRAVVVLRDIHGLDYRGISEALRCSRGTVKSRLHRARAELKRKLGRTIMKDQGPK